MMFSHYIYVSTQFPTQLRAAGIAPKKVGLRNPPSDRVPTRESPPAATQRFIDDLHAHIMETMRFVVGCCCIEVNVFVYVVDVYVVKCCFVCLMSEPCFRVDCGLSCC